MLEWIIQIYRPGLSARDQDGGTLQAAPHKGSARAAADLEGGVEEEGGEDARA